MTGAAASVVVALLATVYFAAVAGGMIIDGLAFPPAAWVQVVGGITSLGLGVVLVILMAALRRSVPEDRRLFGDLALVFMALLCVSTGTNRYVQFSIVPQYAGASHAAALELIHPYGGSSVMFGIETVGWGLFYGLGAVFAGLAVAGRGLDRWIFALLVLGGFLSLLYALGFILHHPVLSLLGFPAWAILLPITAVLLALRFGSMAR
jgi:hypothetical protein